MSVTGNAMIKSCYATALWITGPEQVEVRETAYDVSPGDLQIETLFSGISRGTERVIWQGRVPAGEHATMRAPFQAGEFTFPVKYGYCAVGRIQNGTRLGESVFVLAPHQTNFALPEHVVVPVPVDVPPERAVLAANMETALNIIWDAQLMPGDKIAVVGCGVVGALVAYLASRIVGTEVCALDINASRADVLADLGISFQSLEDSPKDNDVVIHTSASAAGLATCIDLAGTEATIIEASWYGDEMTEVPLGGRFHQRRLKIIGSQVGRIPANQAARWTYRRRLEKAMTLLADPKLDALISGETGFADIAENYGAILQDPETLCHRIRYETNV